MLGGTRVFTHSEIIEDRADITCELPHFLSDAENAFGFNDSNGKPSESGDVLWTIAATYTATIFIVVPIKDVVATLNAPMASIGGENVTCVGFSGRLAGDAIGGLTRAFARLFICAVTFDHESLPDVREVQVVAELVGGPDFTGFDASMIGRRCIHIIWFFPVLEKQGDILKECRLVCLYGEVIVGLALQDQVVRDTALG